MDPAKNRVGPKFGRDVQGDGGCNRGLSVMTSEDSPSRLVMPAS